MLSAIYFDNNTDPVVEQKEEVHALAREVLFIASLSPSERVIMQIDLRNQGGQPIVKFSAEALVVALEYSKLARRLRTEN
jgi:hypothetical protein